MRILDPNYFRLNIHIVPVLFLFLFPFFSIFHLHKEIESRVKEIARTCTIGSTVERVRPYRLPFKSLVRYPWDIEMLLLRPAALRGDLENLLSNFEGSNVR